jgi:N-acetyl-anhydromuramyl-L-alanine amidase AmpD
MYDVEAEDIARVNNLRDSTQLEMGQKLLIPGAAPLRYVIPLYRSNKWKYIIVHHTATEEGNALLFFKSHLRRGFPGGLGYHFVIDNGTRGKEDGQIEIAPRWIRQQDGAHTRAAGMNHKGIGIALVGNFSKEKVSRRQMDSLVFLVNLLKNYYKIPVKNILGHGQVPGANTECPGRHFPWEEFYSKLREAK